MCTASPLTIANIRVIFGDFVQADVPLVFLRGVGVGHPRRQSDNEGLCKFDGVSAHSIVIRIQQCQNIVFHLGHHIPACLLHVWDTLGAHQPLEEWIKIHVEKHKILTNPWMNSTSVQMTHTCKATLYRWVSVRMAFFTTLTLSSFISIFKLAISRRRSSLSLLLHRQDAETVFLETGHTT